MNRRLLGVLVLVAFTLLAAVTAGAYAGRQATTTTLTMWSYDNQDPGLEPVLKQLSQGLREEPPRSQDQPRLQGLQRLVGTVPRALASGSGPDVTEGNQGYQTDAQLVKAKLILPLTKYVKKYGWDKLYAPSTWGMFRWTPDGKSFGKGPVWGIAQTGQNVVAFYQQEEAVAARLQPEQDARRPLRGSTSCSRQLRAKLPDDDPVIEAGNKEGYGFIHLFGGIWGAYVKPQTVRNWIYHVPGSRYDTPGTIKALAKLQRGARRATSTTTTTRVGYDASAGGVREGQGRDVDRRRLGLDDHQGQASAPRTSA